MNVTTKDYFYLVTTPTGLKFAVYKDHHCTCGKPECHHVKAVGLYLKMGGRQALSADAPRPKTVFEEFQQRVSRIRESHVIAIASSNVDGNTAYLLDVLFSTDEKREALKVEMNKSCLGIVRKDSDGHELQ